MMKMFEQINLVRCQWTRVQESLYDSFVLPAEFSVGSDEILPRPSHHIINRRINHFQRQLEKVIAVFRLFFAVIIRNPDFRSNK